MSFWFIVFMKRFYFLFFILLLAAHPVYSQSDEESEKKWTLTPQILNIDYRNKIFVNVFKKNIDSISTGIHYNFNLSSQKQYECKNYEIVSNIDTSGNRIIITLYGIKSPVVCITAAGPATYKESIELKNGNYLLLLRYDGMVDTYKLRVRNGMVRLDEDSVEFSRKYKRPN
jgi:hypothetical protein